mmetsp:Transcript_45827/g.132709  ORF Transcript_45827/g.132709 Transcript_45827/m.132709 type:complete len:220 (-) Transcript_45827:355-1014(-)
MPEAVRRAVHVQGPGRRGRAAPLEDEPPRLGAEHPAQAHDVLLRDAPELGHLGPAHGGTAELLGPDFRVHALQHTHGFKPQQVLPHAARRRLAHAGLPRPVRIPEQEPGVVRHHPPDPRRRGAVVQEPEHRVDARLAGADDDVFRVRRADFDKVVNGNHWHLRLILRWLNGWHHGRQIGGIYNSHAHGHIIAGVARQDMAEAPVGNVLAHGEVPHAASL